MSESSRRRRKPQAKTPDQLAAKYLREFLSLGAHGGFVRGPGLRLALINLLHIGMCSDSPLFDAVQTTVHEYCHYLGWNEAKIDRYWNRRIKPKLPLLRSFVEQVKL